MYFILTLISLFFQLIPRRISLAFGRLIGKIIYHIYPVRKSIALSNLNIAFPNYSLNEKKYIIKKCYKHFGMVFVDFFCLPKYKRKQNNYIVHLDKKNIQYLKQQPGGIILSGHIGNWEYIGPTLSKHNIKSAGVALTQKNAPSNKFFNKLRITKNMKVIPVDSGSKIMIDHIKNGYYLGLISDQNAGKKGTNALFFNRQVSVPKGAAAFHLKTNKPILLGFCILCKDLQYKLSFKKLDLTELPSNPNDIIEEINIRFTKILEKTVKEYPEQYFWFHRKWSRTIYEKKSKF